MNKPSGIKDKNAILYISYLEKELLKFTSSPYYDSYLSLSMMVDKINLKVRSIEFDTTTDDGEAEFKRASKMTDQIGGLIDQMEKLRGKMSPEEKKKLEERPLGLAERMALNDLKDGN